MCLYFTLALYFPIPAAMSFELQLKLSSLKLLISSRAKPLVMFGSIPFFMFLAMFLFSFRLPKASAAFPTASAAFPTAFAAIFPPAFTARVAARHSSSAKFRVK